MLWLLFLLTAAVALRVHDSSDNVCLRWKYNSFPRRPDYLLLPVNHKGKVLHILDYMDSPPSLELITGLTRELISHIHLGKALDCSWNGPVFSRWVASLISRDSGVTDVCHLIHEFGQMLDLGVVWQAQMPHWDASLRSCSTLADISDMLLVIENAIPVHLFIDYVFWESYVSEWLKTIEMFRLSELSTVRNTILKAFELPEEEFWSTTGHRVLSVDDAQAALEVSAFTQYGELMPVAVHRILDGNHLNADEANAVYDLGMGLGKAIMQAYLTHSGCPRFVGVELSSERYSLAAAALGRLTLAINATTLFNTTSGVMIEDSSGRTLELRKGNLFDQYDALDADVVILETSFYENMLKQVADFLLGLKNNSRVIFVEDMRKLLLTRQFSMIPVSLFKKNLHPTTWSPPSLRGSKFNFWVRNLQPATNLELSIQ